MTETVLKKLQKPTAASEKLTVDDILRVATSIFARHGYRNTDVQVIADELGIGKSDNLSQISDQARALLRRRRSRHGASTRAPRLRIGETPDSRPPLTVCAAASANISLSSIKNADLVELFFQERAEFSDRPEMTFFVHKKRRLAKTRQFIQELVDSGAVRKVSVEKLSDIFGYALYGCLFVHHLTGKEKTLGQRADDIIEILINDLLSVDGAPQKSER